VASKQKDLARQVFSCYQAGPTGFWLHRQLTALGLRNYAVCPTCLDECHHGVNNERTDTLEPATRLDRYLAGNDRALAVVRVPTEAEEQKRAHKRQRQLARLIAGICFLRARVYLGAARVECLTGITRSFKAFSVDRSWRPSPAS
jgi:transposase